MLSKVGYNPENRFEKLHLLLIGEVVRLLPGPSEERINSPATKFENLQIR